MLTLFNELLIPEHSSTQGVYGNISQANQG